MPLIDIAMTATYPEVAWTAIGLVALVVNAGLTRNAWQDYTALIRLDKNGARRIAARTAVAIQAGLTAPQAIAVIIGVTAMLTPPANPGRAISLPLLIITYGLILNELILVGVAIYTHVGRRVLLNYLDGTEESAGASRHAETMAELVHNTEVSTEARDGALESFHAANDVNNRIIGVQKDIAETNRIAGESAESLHEYMEKLEAERKEREGC